jgi:hypothetical protein
MEVTVEYLYWDVDPGSNVCLLGSVQNVEDDFQLLRGISRIVNWPENASYVMDKDRPTDIRLEDCLWNVGRLLVVSEKVKNLLEAEKLKNNEFLPVRIINHKDRPVKESYFILNQIGLQDCIDLERSEYKQNRINPEYFSIMKRLVIDEGRIEADTRLFRMKKYPKIPIVYRSLAQKLIDAGIIGAEFIEIEKYRGA